jgi:hypothetical protein
VQTKGAAVAVRRWVRYETPIMVCVDVDDNGYDGDVVAVVLADEHDDIGPARDLRGHFLIYDQDMQRVEAGIDDPIAGKAFTIAEYREWPARLDWEQGPDALRYPFLYEAACVDEGIDDDDVELEEHG